jgi:hypothetical protein
MGNQPISLSLLYDEFFSCLPLLYLHFKTIIENRERKYLSTGKYFILPVLGGGGGGGGEGGGGGGGGLIYCVLFNALLFLFELCRKTHFNTCGRFRKQPGIEVLFIISTLYNNLLLRAVFSIHNSFLPVNKKNRHPVQ